MPIQNFKLVYRLPFKRSKLNRSDSLKYIFVTKSGMAIAAINIGKKLQDFFHRVTAINTDNYLNEYAGLFAANMFCKIFASNDVQNVNYDCGINERYLILELTWQLKC